jgi:hypothetical protein
MPMRDLSLLHLKDIPLLRQCADHQAALCSNDQSLQVAHDSIVHGRQETHWGILLVRPGWSPRLIFLALWHFLLSGPDPESWKNSIVDIPAPPQAFIEERAGYPFPTARRSSR